MKEKGLQIKAPDRSSTTEFTKEDLPQVREMFMNDQC